MEWLYVLMFPGSLLISAAFGVVYLRRFAKTREKRSLRLGLALLLGLPGLLVLVVYGWYWLADGSDQPHGVTCYMPAVFGPAPSLESESEAARAQRTELEDKYRGRVSTETFNKLSGGVFDSIPSDIGKTVSRPGEKGGGRK